MLLTILIPTFNRENEIIFNLDLLERYILSNNLDNNVSILVSNNCSTDNTHFALEKFKEKTNVKFNSYTQSENIGLERNALFTLEKAHSEYIMYLGDDDYLEERYLVEVIESIKENKNISCIIPSFAPISPNKEILSGGRDINVKTKLYSKGFKSTKENSFRGHQLSGLTFKRNGLLEEYKKRNVQNIYPFIFFTAFSTLVGETLHLTKYPVKVTQPGQEKKDWGYGNDGLMNEIFDNYKKLPVNNYRKTVLQVVHFRKQSGRLWMYYSQGFRIFLKSFVSIWFSNNSTFLFKVVFPFMVFAQGLKSIWRKIYK